MKKLKIIVGCEESQAVTRELRKLGHEAYSCDILDCSGGHPEWHIKGDIFKAIESRKWDIGIFFPPCTYLSVAGNKYFSIEKYGEKAIQRHKNREMAVLFFMMLVNCGIPKIAIENPIGTMSSQFRKPDQIVHPYYFGDTERKATCLWLSGLDPLVHDKKNHVEPNIVKYKNGKGSSGKWHMDTFNLPAAERSKARSKTFPGIAKAMAEQWTK